MLKLICLFLIYIVGGRSFSSGTTRRDHESHLDAEYKKEHPNATINDKVNYRTGKGIPVRERDDGVLVDRFGNPTPYQRRGNPNAAPIAIKEGPDC